MKCFAKESPRILECTNHVLAVYKPAGMVTQGELAEWARAWVREEFGKPGRVFLEAAHRLDRPVAGIVLFARTSKALSRLQKSVRERRWKKRYTALVEGELEGEGRWNDRLVHGEFRAYVDEGGKEAELLYRVLERRKGCTLLEITLVTGRYHQIRVQAASRGHPVVGDGKYGSGVDREAIALVHTFLEVPAPVGEGKLSWEVQAKF